MGGLLEDPSAFLVDLDALDAALSLVLDPLRDADLNEAIAEVREGRMLPSTEALARWIFLSLEERIPGSARLEGVRVAESDELASEYRRGED